MEQSDEKLISWIWFAELPQFNRKVKHSLLHRYGDPANLLKKVIHGRVEEKADDDLIHISFSQKDLHKPSEILSLCRSNGIQILTFDSEAYPERLRQIDDCPLILYYKGRIPDFENSLTIGIVGQRHASEYGKSIAGQFARELGTVGVITVTGGAEGIDTAATLGGLDSPSPTVVILGSGLLEYYPKSNCRLFDSVSESGCLMSEYPPLTKPAKWNFPERNRIISGLSNGVIVVEAPLKSGSLITARYALDQGRDLFAVPGKARAECSLGSNNLLRQGALFAETIEDVISAYQNQYEFVNQADSEVKSDLEDQADQNPILTAMGTDPLCVDELSFKTGIPAGKLLSELTLLQIQGVVRSVPGGLFLKI